MKKTLCLLIAFLLLLPLSVTGVSAAEETQPVEYGTKTDAAYGGYTYVNITGLTPYVFIPTGAGSSNSADFTNVTGMMNTYGKANDIVVAINGGIFYNFGLPKQYCFNYKEADGIVIANGLVVKSAESLDHTGCDVLVIDEAGNIGWTDYYADADALAAGKGYYYDIKGNRVEGKKIVSAVTGFVPIVVDGKSRYNSEDAVLNGFTNFVGHYSQKAVRQIFGVKSDGSYGILTNSTLWSLADAAEVALKEGFVFAYNLDGGGSAETVVASGTGDDYKFKTLVTQLRGVRPLPSYIVFTADNEAPVSAAASSLNLKLNNDTFYRGTGLDAIAKAMTVTETYKNADGRESSRILYSRQVLDTTQTLEHTIIGGSTTLTGATVKKTDTSPNGTLYYTKTDSDASSSLLFNSNTRQGGKYYDYSTGYTLSASDDLSTEGVKTITVTYIPGKDLPPLTAATTIIIKEAAKDTRPAPVFDDVKDNDWYYTYVTDICKKSLMKGISDTQFNPGGELTRGMVVTVLYRLAGQPETSAVSPFTDLTEDWYVKAVNWAYSEGIVTGKTDTTFAPKASITREQLVTMLYRYAVKAGISTSGADIGASAKYSDWKRISDYAVEAMNWANGANIINGMTDTEIAPEGYANRAQFAAIIIRFSSLYIEAK